METDDRELLVNEVKMFCENNKMTFVDDVKVGKSLLILISGDNSAKKLKRTDHFFLFSMFPPNLNAIYQ